MSDIREADKWLENNPICDADDLNKRERELVKAAWQTALSANGGEAFEVTNDMVMDFHDALTDVPISENDFNEVKIGLAAALRNLTHPAPPSVVVPEFLLEMSKQMREQPNRMTAHPFWQVRCNRYLPTLEGYSEHHIEICGDDGVVYRSDRPVSELHEYLIENHEEWCQQWAEENHDDDEWKEAIECHFDLDCDDLPDELRKVPVQEVEEVVSTHLTQAGAEQFIKRKQHDYPKLFTYVESAYWSPQLRELQDWIISLTAAPSPDHSGDANRKGAIPFAPIQCGQPDSPYRDNENMKDHIADAGKVVPEVSYSLHHVSLLYQVMRRYDSTIDDVALDSMRDTLRHALSPAPSVPENEIKARVVSGARDMLRESGKQFRAIGDIGHAAMCENHADELDRLRTTDDKAEGV